MAVKSKTPSLPEAPQAKPIEAPQAKPIEVTVGYGCTLIDPLTNVIYSTFPKPLVPSAWADVQLSLKNLVVAP